MATTTTNFGWDIPQSTDLVKDGATAIAALGQDIDTAFVDFKGGTTGQVLKKTSGTDLDVEWGTASSGLTLINTTSFSAVSSQSFNDVFSSTYDNYRVLATGTVSSTRAAFRLRVSGADATGNNYEIGFSSNGGVTTTTATYFIPVDGAAQWWISFDLFSPFAAAETRMLSLAGNATSAFRFSVLRHTLTNSYTGITILPEGAGTITGAMSIYGYNK